MVFVFRDLDVDGVLRRPPLASKHVTVEQFTQQRGKLRGRTLKNS